MLFSVLTRQGKAPRHNVYSPRSQSWLTGGRSQLAAPLGPGSLTLPSYHHWGSQMSKLTGSQAPPAAQGGGAGPTDWNPHKLLLILGHRDKNGGEVQHCWRPGPRILGGLGEGFWALPDTVPTLFPWSPITHWPKTREQAGGPRGEGKHLPLASLSTWWPPPYWPLAKSSP